MNVTRYLQGLGVALSLLTTLPIPGRLSFSAPVQGASLLMYPLVGLLLGGLLVALSAYVPLPIYLLAAVIVAAWAILTGGLHLDGLADCADALTGGFGNRERTLELLKDPLCGAMAVIALVLVLLLKTLGVAALLQSEASAFLWLVPLLARSALLGLFLTTPYVRADGLGSVLAQHFSRTGAAWVLLLLALLLWMFLAIGIWLSLVATVLLVLMLIRRVAMQRIEGFTGDVAGALVELLEVALLLVLVAQGG